MPRSQLEEKNKFSFLIEHKSNFDGSHFIPSLLMCHRRFIEPRMVRLHVNEVESGGRKFHLKFAQFDEINSSKTIFQCSTLDKSQSLIFLPAQCLRQ